MLKNIPNIISPELLKILAEMGHGDEIVLADANFPAVSCAKRIVRYDGLKMSSLLPAVLELLPLDDFVEKPVALMAVSHNDPTPAIWQEYRGILLRYEPTAFTGDFEKIERFSFYERAKNAFAIIQTGETALYANILLKKGVIS